ncbi:NAD(P)-dependent oxidoreductase [Paenibacillus xylanexedens]|uniref:NAD(P)-dependent oxidoreductase n=1 Tax=Paenibacillus xylanexedens TaxID=528191 RepID=UPI00119DF83A|nr:NAD(P)H-binding protein [Paenibacillus xylanexedens]
MNIIVFGATGKTGREIVAGALKKGYQVTAFVRNPSKLNMPHPNLHVHTGEITNLKDVDSVLKAQHYDVAYSAIGSKGMFKREPLLIQAMHNMVKASEQNGVGKFVHISFAGVRSDASKLGLLYKLIVPNVMRNLLHDHREKDAVIKQSSLNWVLVQPPILTVEPYSGKYVHEVQIQPDKSRKLKMSRANLADFMLKLANDSTYDRKEVFVTE